MKNDKIGKQILNNDKIMKTNTAPRPAAKKPASAVTTKADLEKRNKSTLEKLQEFLAQPEQQQLTANIAKAKSKATAKPENVKLLTDKGFKKQTRVKGHTGPDTYKHPDGSIAIPQAIHTTNSKATQPSKGSVASNVLNHAIGLAKHKRENNK